MKIKAVNNSTSDRKPLLWARRYQRRYRHGNRRSRKIIRHVSGQKCQRVLCPSRSSSFVALQHSKC